jgi:hypothetical protein
MNNGVPLLPPSEPKGVVDSYLNGVADPPPLLDCPGAGVVDIDREAFRMLGAWTREELRFVSGRPTDWEVEVRAASGSIPALEPE